MSVIHLRRDPRTQPNRAARANTRKFPSIQFVFSGSALEFLTPTGIVLPTITGLNGEPRQPRITPKSGGVLAAQFWPNSSGSNTVRTLGSPTTSLRSVEWTYFAEFKHNYDENFAGWEFEVRHHDWQALKINYLSAKAYFVDSTATDITATKNFNNQSMEVWRRCVARHKGTELKIFTEDGTATATTSGALLSPSNAYAYEVGFGGFASCSIAGGFQSALSDEECWGLIENPWQTLAVPQRRLFLLPAAAGGGSSAEIAGTQAGAGTQTGAITTAIHAAGIQLGLGSQSGGLSTAITLAGTVTGIGTQAGDILTRIDIAGAQLGAGLQALSLSTGISVAGIIAGEGAVSGGLTLAITLSGQQLADSLITGGIATAIQIAGQQIGAGAQSGELGGGPAVIGGTQAGEGAQSLILSTTITLTGQQLGEAMLTGSLSTEIRIGAVQNGVGIIIGNIGTAIQIEGAVIGLGGASGAIIVGQEVLLAINPRLLLMSPPRRRASASTRIRRLSA